MLLVFSSHIPSRHEREVSEFRKLEREKSFDEARTAVQSQIEKIFMKTSAENASKSVKNVNNLPRLARRDMQNQSEPARNNVKKRMPSMELSKEGLIRPNGPNKMSNRHNLHTRHSSVDNLTPVKVTARQSNRFPPGPAGLGGPTSNGGRQRARDLEQHLRDKYGLQNIENNNLRRTNSHSSLYQQPENLRLLPSLQPNNAPKTLHRRKSFEPDYGPKSLKYEPSQGLSQGLRDAKLKYLGRMSPEEQVDKYLKSVEKENRIMRQKLRQRELSMQHLAEKSVDYRTTFDPSKHLPTGHRLNSSITSRWHSLDSVSRPVLARNVNDIINRKRPSMRPAPPPVQTGPSRPSRNSPEKMSTGSDNVSKSDSKSLTEDNDSCSCTDVTLDETLKINHNHRKSLARKKKLQVQRLHELRKAEQLNNDNLSKANNGIQANYLGSVKLDSKSSDLLSLQKPLKSLYFKYVISQQAGLGPINGSLEITRTGLKVTIILTHLKSIQSFPPKFELRQQTKS